MFAEDRYVQLQHRGEVDNGKGGALLPTYSKGTWSAVADPPVVSTHDLVHHKLVDEVGVVMRRWLIMIIKKAFVCPLGFFECLNRHIIVLKDDFMKDLVKHLLL